MTEINLEQIKGIVKTVTFHNEETGYTVAKILVEGTRAPVAVTGTVKMLAEGETVVFNGYWVNDPKYGRQFRFHSYESVIPATLEGVKRFLSSQFIKGIGPVLAERIVNTFGTDTMSVLEEHPERLLKVKGISRSKLADIRAGWESHARIRDIMIFLQAHDISPAYASRIYDRYGEETIDILRRNPYQLIDDIRGIGFIKADQIAAKLGIEKGSFERIRAGILYNLNEMVDNGHIFVPLVTLVETAAVLLDCDAARVLEVIGTIEKRKDIIVEEDRVYRADLHGCEAELARLLRLSASVSLFGEAPDRTSIEAMVDDIEKKRNISFAALQRDAVVTAVMSNVFVLTGGPGTGKTTTVLGIIDMFRRLRLSVVLCAPTGRAAKRLSETTGVEAKTIHRLLEFNPHKGRFSKNAGNPLGVHGVILDEASMVDTVLMRDFMRALSPETALIIVGDVDQLPSIGPGNVLRDIIDSGTVPTVRLTEIFRQASTSRIVRCAHLINTGKLPFTDNEHEGNFFFMKAHGTAEIPGRIVDLLTRRLPSRYGFDPFQDIQVLSPMHKGETGVANLNALIQARLNPFNPARPEVRKGDWAFRIGDKVMQIRNNYDKTVFNGDIGRITAIDTDHSIMTVKYEDPVDYQFSELDDIVPAYAISVHKSQGSEFPCIVMPVTTQHYIMLRRNLVYTAVTRARKLVVLIGDVKALAIAVKNDQVGERNTSLKARLMKRELS